MSTRGTGSRTGKTQVVGKDVKLERKEFAMEVL